MNCKEVQEMMWCGNRQEDVEQHIKQCAKCRQEMEMLQEVGFIMERTDIPMPERSLLPSASEIENVVRSHKRRRYTRWTSVGVAAAVVVAAIALTPQMFNNQPSTVDGRQPVSRQETVQQTQTVQQQIDQLLSNYQWTAAGEAVTEAYTLPKTFTDSKGGYPAGLYWDYHNVLSADAGLDLTPHLGQKVTVHSVEVKEQLPTNDPEEVAKLTRTRAFFVEADGQVVGAWVRKGPGGPEASLNRKYFADLHQGSWGQWLQEQGQVDTAAAANSPEETIKNFFAGFAAKDDQAVYGTLSKQLQFRLMYEMVPDYAPLHKGWADTHMQLDRILSAEVLDIQPIGDMEYGTPDPNDAMVKSLPTKKAGGLKQYRVVLDMKVSQESKFMNGENVIDVTLVREENNDAFPWQIDYLTGAH